MSLFTVHLLSTDLDKVECRMNPDSGRAFLAFRTKGFDSVSMTDNDGKLADWLRSAADQLDAMATPELWAAS